MDQETLSTQAQRNDQNARHVLEVLPLQVPLHQMALNSHQIEEGVTRAQRKIKLPAMAVLYRDIGETIVTPLEYLTTHPVPHQSYRRRFYRKKAIHLLPPHPIVSILVLLLPRRHNDQVSTCQPALQLRFGNMLILGTHQ